MYKSTFVEEDQLTWATSKLSLQLQGDLQSPAQQVAIARPVTSPSASTLPPVERSDDDSILKTWWFWTIVAVVVGGGTATAVVLTQTHDPGVRIQLSY
jgi:hypothetical protein